MGTITDIERTPNPYNWGRLSSLQVGSIGEQYAKFLFACWGWDVYTPELDHRGVDFVVAKNRFLDIQVKTLRKPNYVYAYEDWFRPRESLFMALIFLFQGLPPRAFLIPSTAWTRPSRLLVRKDYTPRCRAPELGVSLTGTTLPMLRRFSFTRTMVSVETPRRPSYAKPEIGRLGGSVRPVTRLRPAVSPGA